MAILSASLTATNKLEQKTRQYHENTAIADYVITGAPALTGFLAEYFEIGEFHISSLALIAMTYGSAGAITQDETNDQLKLSNNGKACLGNAIRCMVKAFGGYFMGVVAAKAYLCYTKSR